MKRATLLVAAVCLASVIGCGGNKTETGGGDAPKVAPGTKLPHGPGKPDVGQLTKVRADLEKQPPEERAKSLRDLAAKNKGMAAAVAKQWVNDPNPTLSAAAKEVSGAK